MSKKHRHIKLREQICVDKIYSFHYNELNKDYIYKGEQHNFWEFLYLDRGELEVTTAAHTFHLKQGEIVFYSPNEFHSLRCNQKTASNIFIIAFDCKSEAMRFFTGKALRLGNGDRELLSLVIEEGNKLFMLPVARPFVWNKPNKPTNPLARKEKPEFGSEQLIKIYMEALFIRLIRNNQSQAAKPKLSSITKEKGQRDLVSRVIDYIETNLLEQPTLSLDRLCSEFAASKTLLRTAFREHTGCGITEYIGRLRIERAKQHIREDTCNVTEIAERLGYSSIHYFSRQFKKATGMAPSEYLKTVKARV